MKQILIILLLAGMAGAQEGIYSARRNGLGTPPTNYTFWKKATGRIYLEHISWADSVFMISGDDTIQLIPKVKPKVRPHPITIGDLEAWIKHCYNDSTQEIIRMYKAGVWYDQRYVYEHYDTVYVHKNPNDIDEQVKWLKFREAVICSLARQQIK